MSGTHQNRRIILIVLDSVGIGALPDAAEYRDQDANTLQHVAAQKGGIHLPTMEAMGLGKLGYFQGVDPHKCSQGAYGQMLEQSKGKDTITGHWELAGIILEQPFQTFPSGFPKELIARFEQEIGRTILANKAASGTEIIKELGETHMRSGSPIVYTSADSVFQIAAHEDIIPPEQLYQICQVARKLCQNEYLVGRVIARPFRGEPGSFYRTERRRDFAIPPPQDTVLDLLVASGHEVISIGKIDDIFQRQGITRSYHTGSNDEGMKTLELVLDEYPSGLIFANLVDFDMKFGHRLDALGYAVALETFDRWLHSFLPKLLAQDILIITADHGCDPTTPGTDHTREYVPLLVWRSLLPGCIELGCRKSFSDVAETTADYLMKGHPAWGTSFLPQIL